MKHKIVIVDDHILIAKALAGIIETFDNFEVMYEAENGKAMIEKMAHKKNVPDIVLLDISMPIMDGFETAAWLKENHPSVLIMTLSMQNDEDSLIKMIRAGAKGYLLKNIHPTELENALNSLVKNLYYYPDWATKSIINNIGIDKNSAFKMPFTDRELEFLSYTCSELSYKEIAEKMFCSPRTVEGYRDALFEKLELKSRVGLAVFAIKNNYCKV
ncbi:MAG: response regulator transcription factor [Chitinophagaceae bacterium]